MPQMGVASETHFQLRPLSSQKALHIGIIRACPTMTVGWPTAVDSLTNCFRRPSNKAKYVCTRWRSVDPIMRPCLCDKSTNLRAWNVQGIEICVGMSLPWSGQAELVKSLNVNN